MNFPQNLSYVKTHEWLLREGGKVKIDYRPVHEYTLTDDVEYIKPKKRVY